MNPGFYTGLASWLLAAVVTMLSMKYTMPEPNFIRASSTLMLYFMPVVFVTGLIFAILHKTRISEWGAQLFFGSGIFLIGLFAAGLVLM